MTTTDQVVLGRLNNEHLAAARYWNTPSSRSARKLAPEFTNERSSRSPAGNSGKEDQDPRQVRFAANRNSAAPADPPSQVCQYTGRNQWQGANFQPESDGRSKGKSGKLPEFG